MHVVYNNRTSGRAMAGTAKTGSARRAGLLQADVVRFQQLLNGQAVFATELVRLHHAARHQAELLFEGRGGLGSGRVRNLVLDLHHGRGPNDVYELGWRDRGGRGFLHALHSLFVGRQSRHDRVAGQRVLVVVPRVFLVPP